MMQHWKNHTITHHEKLIALQQLTQLLQSNLPLALCFKLMTKCQTHPSIKNMMHELHEMIIAGHSLTYSISQYPLFFSHIAQQLIQFGEKTGTLETAFRQLTRLQQGTHTRQQQIKKACLYPCILFCTCFAMLMILLLVIVPRFKTIYANLQATLPTSTKYLFLLSDLIIDHGLLVLILACLLICICYLTIKPSTLVHCLMKLPYLKSIQQHSDLWLLITQLQIALAAGVPLLSALNIMHPSVPRQFKALVHQLTYTTQMGYPLHRTFATANMLPTWLTAMVEIGETAGKLESMLIAAANLLDRDLKQRIDYLLTLTEPLIILILGVLIGGLMVILYLPIFKLGSIV